LNFSIIMSDAQGIAQSSQNTILFTHLSLIVVTFLNCLDYYPSQRVFKYLLW
jgi:hypothetical protein